ncbi:hypothetical protein TSUD_280980 [Trifolium subterraneum]|uniref:Uncharacterized protein n=1 Tax=Trifolium subterraneum TaxID=3900 RepID=A0A2Z6PC56_TRISU|nr:hypothetical protein TSUD_280980 [Trifolium subterraneum]
MPELVVFIQEDQQQQQQQYVKDICIDREVERKCDMNRKSDLNLGIMETMSNNSLSECSSQQFSFKEAMKVHGFRNLMKSEMQLDLGDKFSNDLQLTKKTAETLREAFKRERNISRCFENLQRNSFTGTSGSKVEFPNCTDCVQVTDTNILPAEWNGSPVRMMEADKSQSRKHRWRKMLLPCCDFDD